MTTLSTGVPQGRCVSPLFYSLFRLHKLFCWIPGWPYYQIYRWHHSSWYDKLAQQELGGWTFSVVSWEQPFSLEEDHLHSSWSLSRKGFRSGTTPQLHYFCHFNKCQPKPPPHPIFLPICPLLIPLRRVLRGSVVARVLRRITYKASPQQFKQAEEQRSSIFF